MRFASAAIIAAALLSSPTCAEARRSAMSNTPEVALVADLPNDTRFQAWGENGERVTLDLGWSYREFSMFWMPYAAWREAGFVFYSHGADGQMNLAPATRPELAELKRLTGVDYEADYRFPYWQYFWGWIPSLLVIAGVLALRRREQQRKNAEGIM